MSVALPLPHPTPAPPTLDQALAAACARIAPNWPLDRAIAVNPWWGWIDRPFREACARVQRLSGAATLPPADPHAASSAAAADGAAPAAPRRLLFIDLLDEARRAQGLPACRDLLVHAIGQHCAAWFDRGQARWRAARSGGLYAAWRELASSDPAPSLYSGLPQLARHIGRLPGDHRELIAAACAGLGLAAQEWEEQFTALLLDINGWAAFCAWRRWEARLQGGDDDQLEQLLAIRLGWEWVLATCCAQPSLLHRWQAARGAPATQSDALAWQRLEATERHWQQPLHRRLLEPPATASVAARPTLQAVFCIDVRSERLRRALESCDAGVRTHGTAGFFGMAVAHHALGAEAAQACVPGLLAPRLQSTEVAADPAATARLTRRARMRRHLGDAWRALRSSATGGFAYVEAVGWAAAASLLRDGWALRGTTPARTGAAAHAGVRPRLLGLDPAARVNLAAHALDGMGLHDELAPVVLLVGHGSSSRNNPHAASLACGACGGHSGDVNARLLADLLNSPEVRAGLHARGRRIDDDTRFVAALHDTTTDTVRLFDADAPGPVPAAGLLERTRAWLQRATAQAQAERAAALGLGQQSAAALDRALRRRAVDWSEVRPEWGLANNAGFIAAPRRRTRHIDLAGRCFLHDYDYRHDAQGELLAQILAAPMVVAHWINLQYFASSVDNHRWGSGDKTLHNVVGGGIGVFEGNGGDLRIGLPLQSLHDGHAWRHAPQRLSVWVEAPPERLARAIDANSTVAQLVDGAWLHLFCIDPEQQRVLRCVSRAGTRAWVDARDRS